MTTGHKILVSTLAGAILLLGIIHARRRAPRTAHEEARSASQETITLRRRLCPLDRSTGASAPVSGWQE
jgi:hypothetical protein